MLISQPDKIFISSANVDMRKSIEDAGLPKKSIALLEQLRTIDKSRLKEKIGEITQTSLNKIDKGLLISLGCFEDRRCKK